MKKMFVIAIAGAFIISSCGDSKKEGGMSDAAKKNLEAQHGVMKCFETKDFSKIGDYIAEDAVDYASGVPVKGLANMKAEFEKMSAMFENNKGEVIKELADDEYVMSWVHFTGIMKVDQMGMKAGDKYDSKAVEVTKFKDGKAIEHWTYMDPAEMTKMMGGAPPPTGPTDGKMETKPDSPAVKTDAGKM